MANHDISAMALGTVTLFKALVKHLNAKGLLTNQEYEQIVRDALAGSSGNSQAEAIHAFIKDAVNAPADFK